MFVAEEHSTTSWKETSKRLAGQALCSVQRIAEDTSQWAAMTREAYAKGFVRCLLPPLNVISTVLSDRMPEYSAEEICYDI